MTDTKVLASFPSGEFAAFSTAKMSYFLPMRADMTRSEIEQFFGEDAKFVALTPMPTVELHLPDTKVQIAHPGDIIAHFINGKYKVISEEYYNKNFNAPIVDKDDHGMI
ncbi:MULTISPECIES: hypothetical protein [Lacticaseibacillus]|uniref:Uncharacterized protein n=2 Tax=Lacticaseibacillus TaxID=2759736 RepID=A0ABW4CED6_9LACO|nr:MULTISPECIES: hypothetical protein [Lacticaseibacillus]